MACIGMKAMITAIGRVRIGISALGMCQRKSRMTKETMMSSSRSVSLSVSMERLISSERS